MRPVEAALLAGAGLVARTVNTIAGAGPLLAFPTLLGAGLSPLAANVTNCPGVIPGSISGAYGMRRELRGRRRLLVRLSLWVGLGSGVGAALLLELPGAAFDRVVPVLVGLAGLLVVVQPLVVRRTRGREQGRDSGASGPAVGTVGTYSGCFGAAQGGLLIGVLGVLEPADLRRTNARKNVLAVTAKGLAGLVYAALAPVDSGGPARVRRPDRRRALHADPPRPTARRHRRRLAGRRGPTRGHVVVTRPRDPGRPPGEGERPSGWRTRRLLSPGATPDAGRAQAGTGSGSASRGAERRSNRAYAATQARQNVGTR